VSFIEKPSGKSLRYSAQQCITRDNVSITVDVVYWRIVDMEKAYYKVENLKSAMVNLVLTQIRSEMGQLELDETLPPVLKSMNPAAGFRYCYRSWG